MTREEYKQKVDDLVESIGENKERLWRALDREDYKVAAELRDRIQEQQKELMKILSNPVPDQ